MDQISPKETERPMPPSRLRYKVAGNDFIDWFERSGQLSVIDLERALASIGRSFGEFNDVMEWGCGCGRILRHLPEPKAPKRLYGNDIDQEAIDWVAANLPWVEISTTEGLPPLPYPDESFDLIYNHSVMTHLDERYQDAWLAELKRVLKPGGVVTLTVSGRNAFQMYLDTLPAEGLVRNTQSAALHTQGLLYIGVDQWTGDFPDFYHTAFHDVDYVFNRWSKYLDIRSYIPRGALDYQDMVVLQKPAPDSAGPGAYYDYLNRQPAGRLNELQQSVTSLQRERQSHEQALQRANDEAARSLALLREAEAKLQKVYDSRSWQMTRPWRLAGRVIKQLNDKSDPER